MGDFSSVPEICCPSSAKLGESGKNDHYKKQTAVHFSKDRKAKQVAEVQVEKLIWVFMTKLLHVARTAIYRGKDCILFLSQLKRNRFSTFPEGKLC